MDLVVKRIQEDVGAEDGTRVLVDRIWPRGIRKADAELDAWNKDVAPSTELRQWYGHDPTKFEEFSRRYRKELQKNQQALQELRESASGARLTLLTATKDTEHSHAAVLEQLLRG